MSCVIFGTGPGLGSALAKKFASEGLHVALVARSKEFLESLSKEIQSSGGKATPFICDVSKEDSIKKCFKDMKSSLPPLKVLIYNVAVIKRAPFLTQTYQEFQDLFTLLAGGAFVSSQIAITEMLRNEMLENGKGTLLFSGASSSLRGSKNFATFSPAKFALRSLSQSLAREFHPQGIHVGHVVIDGVIEQEKTREWIKEGTGLKPESLANVYFDLYKQDRSSWTQEIDTRPFCENF